MVTIRGLVPAASISTFSQAAMEDARCTPTAIGTTHRSTITFRVNSGGLPPSLKKLPRSRLALAVEDANQWWSGFG
jgi:hypothetical protein